MKLILVRHGETDANIAKILMGHVDGKLSKKGHDQTKLVAERFKNYSIDKIYASDLSRAKDTVNQIKKYHSETEVIYNPMLRELNLGELEGKQYGSHEKAVKASGKSRWDYKPQNGESIREFHERITSVLEYILDNEKNGTMMIVSHGGTMFHFYMELFGIPEKEFWNYLPGNTAVSEIEIRGNGNHEWFVKNCVKHLEIL